VQFEIQDYTRETGQLNQKLKLSAESI